MYRNDTLKGRVREILINDQRINRQKSEIVAVRMKKKTYELN